VSRRRRFVRLLLGAAIVVGAVWLSGARLYAFPGKSMMPAVMPGDYFIALMGPWRHHTPVRFEMVIYDVPADSKWAERKIPWMKRLVGLPGEHVQLTGAELFIDGRKITAPTLHTRHPAAKTPDVDVQLGPDEFFFLGDNLDESFDDSRSMGKISRRLLRGFVAQVIHVSQT
jgi:signal peptidase I